MCCSLRKWLRAFTLKEVIYTVVEAILLLVLILFLLYLVLHLSVCPQVGRNRDKQSGRTRSNVSDTLKESLNKTRILNITNLRESDIEGGYNVTSTVTNDSIVSAGQQIKDSSPNTNKASLNVSSEVTNGTIASANEGNKSIASEYQSSRSNVVRTVKIAESSSVTSVEIKGSESREGSNKPSDQVEYEQDEPGPNNTLTPKVQHCKKCEEARREHERGKCDCGACAPNRTDCTGTSNHTRQTGPTVDASNHTMRTGLTTDSSNLTVRTELKDGASNRTVHTKLTDGALNLTMRRGLTVEVSILETKITDDDVASELHKSVMVALVRAEPDDTFTYECACAVVAERWALTAAACIRDLSADTLGLHFLVERFGEEAMGDSHGVVEAARGGGVEALALRAASSLLARGGRAVRLADPLDHLLLVLGDTFTALGYGKFR